MIRQGYIPEDVVVAAGANSAADDDAHEPEALRNRAGRLRMQAGMVSMRADGCGPVRHGQEGGSSRCARRVTARGCGALHGGAARHWRIPRAIRVRQFDDKPFSPAKAHKRAAVGERNSSR
jgi:hypothetical protein